MRFKKTQAFINDLIFKLIKNMQVNLKMLNNIIEEEDDCFVFFYDQVDPDAHAILSELEGMSIEE